MNLSASHAEYAEMLVILAYFVFVRLRSGLHYMIYQGSLDNLLVVVSEHEVQSGRKATQGCPCGFYNDHLKNCTCTPHMIQRYLQRISGPMLDRIDIHIEVPRLKQNELISIAPGEPSANIRARVHNAREIQNQRFVGTKIFSNAQMIPKQHCKLM